MRLCTHKSLFLKCNLQSQFPSFKLKIYFNYFIETLGLNEPLGNKVNLALKTNYGTIQKDWRLNCASNPITKPFWNGGSLNFAFEAICLVQLRTIWILHESMKKWPGLASRSNMCSILPQFLLGEIYLAAIGNNMFCPDGDFSF